jgi:hypothetical protein
MTNGVVNAEFYSADDARPTDSYILKPLEKWNAKILVPAAVDARTMGDIGWMGGGHGTFPCMYTGGSKVIPGSKPLYFTSTYPSIHKAIADALAKRVTLRMPILDCGVHAGDLVWLAAGQKNTAERDPRRLFDRMFSSPVSTPVELAALRARRKSVLDLLRGDLAAFQARLGTEDRDKIDTHLASLRELEAQLSPSAASASCAKPEASPSSGIVYECGSQRFEAHQRAFNTLVAVAIGCDLTRVANMALGYDLGSCPDPVHVPGFGPLNYHGPAHEGSRSYGSKKNIDRFFFQLFADLVAKLDAYAEPGGTALDNTAAVLINDMNSGENHWCGGLPTVIAGSCGGYFRTGRVIRLGTWAGKPPKYFSTTSGVAHNRLLAELSNAMDVPTEKVGTYGGTLPEIRA